MSGLLCGQHHQISKTLDCNGPGLGIKVRVGRKLVESIRHATVVERTEALRDFAVRPLGVREALARVLQGEERHFNATRWAGTSLRSTAGQIAAKVRAGSVSSHSSNSSISPAFPPPWVGRRVTS